MRTGLAVLVDGVALPDEEAHALWQRFSDWMEEHRGDLAGFATREGFASIHPGVDNGKPVLIASRTAPQRPYGPASSVAQPEGGGDGSKRRQDPRPSNRSGHKKPRK